VAWRGLNPLQQQPGSGREGCAEPRRFALVLTAITLTVSPLRIRILMRSVGFFCSDGSWPFRSLRASDTILGGVGEKGGKVFFFFFFFFPRSSRATGPNTPVLSGCCPRRGSPPPLSSKRSCRIARSFAGAIRWRRPYDHRLHHIGLLVLPMLGHGRPLTAGHDHITDHCGVAAVGAQNADALDGVGAAVIQRH